MKFVVEGGNALVRYGDNVTRVEGDNRIISSVAIHCDLVSCEEGSGRASRLRPV
jgi:hypothetical protein